jgi:hypothetical protein
MPAINKTVDGLLLQEDFSTLTGWTGDTGSFSVISNQPAFIPFGYYPIEFSWTPLNFDNFGVREPTILVENDIWYLLYDGGYGGIGSTKWISHMAISRDRGLTWERVDDFGPGDDDGLGGTLTYGYAMGWIAKFSSTYYLYRVLLAGANGGPPYYGDIWSASDILGPYTYQSALPLTPGEFTAHQNLPGSIFKDGSTYYLMVQGKETGPSNYSIGKMSASSPTGTWTLDTNTIINSSNYVGGDPENPRVFYHSPSGVYVMLFNAFVFLPEVRAIRNATAVSTSLTDWSASRKNTIQRECPMDGERAIGVMSNFTAPDNALIVGENGFIPVYYDADGIQNSVMNVDYAYKRTIRGSVLEPSLTTFQYTGAAATLKSVYKTLSHTDFEAEFTIEFLTTVASTNGGLWFRSDGTGNNGYRVVIRNGDELFIDKYVAGVNTSISTPIVGLQPYLGMASRVRVVAAGTSIKVYFDGELQADITDASLSSGTHIGVFGFGAVSSQYRLLSVRASNTVTLTGLQPGTNVIVRADGKIPVMALIANASGEASFTRDHFPLETFEIDGVDYTPTGGIWGGDTYVFTGFPAYPIPGNLKRALKF